MSVGWRRPCVAVVGALVTALFLAASAGAASPAKVAPLAMDKETLVFTRGPGTSVDVFQLVTLSRKATSPWTVPMPHGAYRVAPQSAHVHYTRGRVVAPAGSSQASVAYRLPGRLGSVFVQNVALSIGKVHVLAVPGVYPGVGTGLSLGGQTRIAGKEFTVFTGGSQGPGGVVHFSLTVGTPGRPWTDALGVVLVLWLALGTYLGSRRLMAILHSPEPGPEAA